MTAAARCLRCYKQVDPAQPHVTCPDCQGVHHDACWNQQGGCAACVPHAGEPEPEPAGRDRTFKLTPRQPLAKPPVADETVAASRDDETVGLKRDGRGLDPPPVDPDDTLHIQPDDGGTLRAGELQVAHEDLETAFLHRREAPRADDETRVMKPGERATESPPAPPEPEPEPPQPATEVPAPEPSVADPVDTAQPERPEPPPRRPRSDRIQTASERLRRRQSGSASARVSARVARPGLGWRGKAVVVALALIGLGTLFGLLLMPDLIAPELVILTPAAGEVPGTQVDVRGRVGDASPVRVWVDGQPAGLVEAGGALEFHGVVRRDALGATEVEVRAEDAAGNVTRRLLALTFVAPALTITLEAPEPDAAVGGAAVAVRGRIETDAVPTRFEAVVEAVVGEQAVPVAADGSFALEVPLTESPQTVRVVVRGAGSEAALERTVTVDRDPPRLELLRPHDAVTVAATVRVTARVFDAAPWVDVTLGGHALRVPRGELFSAQVALRLGENRLALTPIDAAGQAGEPLELTVTRLEPLRPRAFDEAWRADPSSWSRYLAVRRLDPLDDRPQRLGVQGEVEARALPLLARVLAEESWYLRSAAIEALSDHVDDVFAEALRARLAEPVPGEASGWVRALGRSGDPAQVPALRELLAHGDARVAASAAAALAELPTREAVTGLIEALAAEARPTVAQAQARALQSLTRQPAREPEAWRRWWVESGRAAWSRAAPAALAPRGDRHELAAGGVRLGATLRGAGAPALVLGELGWEVDYLGEALAPLEDALHLALVDLPAKADFDPPPGDDDDPDAVVAYPAARLSDALEALRAGLVADGVWADEPVTVIAHGTAGWLALAHARRAPQQVARLILVATPPGEEVWRGVQGRLGRHAEQVGDHELARLARAWRDVGGPPASPFSEEGQALVRAAWTSQFADPRPLELGRLLGPLTEKRVGGRSRVVRELERPLVGLAPAAFSVADLGDHPAVPTWVVYGERSLRYAPSDFESMAKRLEAGSAPVRAVAFADCGDVAPLEAPVRFVGWLRRVLAGE